MKQNHHRTSQKGKKERLYYITWASKIVQRETTFLEMVLAELESRQVVKILTNQAREIEVRKLVQSDFNYNIEILRY